MAVGPSGVNSGLPWIGGQAPPGDGGNPDPIAAWHSEQRLELATDPPRFPRRSNFSDLEFEAWHGPAEKWMSYEEMRGWLGGAGLTPYEVTRILVNYSHTFPSRPHSIPELAAIGVRCSAFCSVLPDSDEPSQARGLELIIASVC